MKRKLESGDKEESGVSTSPDDASVDPAVESAGCEVSIEAAVNVFQLFAEELEQVNVSLDDRFLRFVAAIQASYSSDVPYHNWNHAVDVLRTTAYLISELAIKLQPVETLALLTAALVHDAGHVGRSNDVLEKEQHPLAIRYNNVSILEQQSCTICFEALAREECAFTSELSQEQAALFRGSVIKLVLSTDIAGQERKHLVMKAYERLQPDAFDESQREHRDALMIVVLRCADVGTVIKSEAEFLEWARLLYREYSRLGPCDQSVYMQRQDGFLQFHALPEYRLLMHFLKPEVAHETESKLNRLSSAIKQLDLPTFSDFLNSDRPWGANQSGAEAAEAAEAAEEIDEIAHVVDDDNPDEHEAKKARNVPVELELE